MNPGSTALTSPVDSLEMQMIRLHHTQLLSTLLYYLCSFHLCFAELQVFLIRGTFSHHIIANLTHPELTRHHPIMCLSQLFSGNQSPKRYSWVTYWRWYREYSSCAFSRNAYLLHIGSKKKKKMLPSFVLLLDSRRGPKVLATLFWLVNLFLFKCQSIHWPSTLFFSSTDYIFVKCTSKL